jgi:hypothetical protein
VLGWIQMRVEGEESRGSMHTFPHVCGPFFSAFGLTLPKDKAGGGAAGAGASICILFQMRDEGDEVGVACMHFC